MDFFVEIINFKTFNIMSLTLILIVIFLLGIALVAFEEQIGVNKSATALLMSVVMWVVVALNGGTTVNAEIIAEQLGEVSETLFFVMGALVIVELTDIHGGFRVITNSIRTQNKRTFLWIIALLTFFLSAVLDNIATAVIMVALVRKFVDDQPTRWIYAGAIIIAANAGGSFSPVGDVTTILLWTGGNLTPGHQIASVFPASLTFMVVPLLLIHFFYFKKGEKIIPPAQSAESGAHVEVSSFHSNMILFLAISTMALVPWFQHWSTLPPFMRILLGLSLMWIYTDKMYGGKALGKLSSENKYKVGSVISRIDMSTILFFLGVLMSVSAMKVAGTLVDVGVGLEEGVGGHPLVISFIIGVMSSFVDNVALVAATQGMYPLAEAGTYMVDSVFWTFLAYCSVTGGSLLIIGSATGVTVMGVEKLTFGYYLKRFSLLALIGYLAGAAVFVLFSF